jgi:PAS domain S-box-containing protein
MVTKENSQFDIKILFENHLFLEQYFQNIEQVVWVIDLSTNHILYVSPTFENVWGCSCEKLYADPFLLIKTLHPEDRVKVMSVDLNEHQSFFNQTYRILRPDGTQRYISAHTFLIQTGSSGTSYQICIAEDTSAQNEVDQVLRKALDRSREQFNLSHKMSLARKHDAVLKTLMFASELRNAKRAFVLFFEPSTGSRSHVIEVIASWSSVAYQPGSNPNESMNETNLFEDIAFLDLFHPSKPVIIIEILKDQRLTPQVRKQLIEEQIQTLAIFPLVALRNWLGCFLVFYPKEKHFEPIELRHIKVLVDQATITLYNLQLLEIEADSRYEAERANEIKTRFLAMISHELRTPLTSIIGFTTTLLANDVTWEPNEQHDFIETIQIEANRLQELIDHLLDLSRLEAGMLPIKLESQYIDKIVEDALPQLHILTSGQTLSIHLPDNLPPVLADAKRIAQVLVNLVRNASTYAPKGTEISITANARQGFVQINVNDQGPGISSNEYKKVFKAFRRGINMENSSTKGAGLGLAICQGLVEAHGGHIWIKKKHTPGATFSFTIPLVPLLAPAGPSEEEQ